MKRSEQVEALEKLYLTNSGYEPPPPEHRIRLRSFRPSLNPTQEKILDETASFILCHGPRYSGKTVGGLHKLVQHCKDNRNALALMIVGVKRMAEEGGAWTKLIRDVLPQWKQGCRLEYTDAKTNAAKDTFLWVANRFGGWSRVVLLSMPVDSFIQDRIKGMEPSFVLLDEAQTFESDAYFKYIVQQVGRVQGIPLQQLVYCCNPDGPSHWLYKRFFELPVTYSETGERIWNPKYAVHYVPIEENKHNCPEGYYENVMEACRDDETEYRRMVLGEWIDAKRGDGLFKDEFNRELHTQGDFKTNQGLVPIRGFPIIVSYDLGQAHSSLQFQQFLASEERLLWLVFDEVNLVDRYVPYTILVPHLLDRMDFWSSRMEHQFTFEHISDNSAFNQFRAATGSFDHQDIERLAGGRIKMKECPKGPGSIETRVRQTKEKLTDLSILVSGMCPKTIEMFINIERDKENPMTPRKKQRYSHPFDSLTYPHLFYGSTRKNQVPTIQTASVSPPQVYHCGAGRN